MKRITIALLFIISLAVNIVSAQQTDFNPLEGIRLHGQWFLAYDMENRENEPSNEFRLKRGYVTFQKAFDERWSARVTQDVSVDQEGDGEGDIEIRLKYGYLRRQWDRWGFLHKPLLEFGLVHRPWIDFEQKINRYRVQSTMYLERYGILRSADYGVTFMSLLGGEMDDAFKEQVNDKYAGLYGSLAVGVYNGGGL